MAEDQSTGRWGPECCPNCGCAMRWHPLRNRISLATPEQRRGVIEKLRSSSSVRREYAALMDPYGYREAWGLGFKCPGCGRNGGDFKPEYTEEEAQAIAERRSRAALTPEAQHEAAHWREEVRRRAELDARLFTELLLARFPEWKPYVRFVSPCGPSIDPETLDWERALVVSVPSENPSVEQPLGISVIGNELLPHWFGGWHAHIQRADDAQPGNPAHLQRGLRLVEALVTEEIVVWAWYRAGLLRAGGQCQADAIPAAPFAETSPHPAEDEERIVLRSWRGTYDGVIPALGNGGNAIIPSSPNGAHFTLG